MKNHSNPIGCTTSFIYDKANRQTQHVDAFGNPTSTAFYPDSQPQVTVNALNHRTTFSYDRANRQLTQWEYDRTYQLVHESRAGSFSASFTYDPVGNRLTQQEGGALTTADRPLPVPGLRSDRGPHRQRGEPRHVRRARGKGSGLFSFLTVTVECGHAATKTNLSSRRRVSRA